MTPKSLIRTSLALCIPTVLGGFALAFGATTIAEAQYYPPGPGYYRDAPPPRYYDGRPRYREQPRYREDGYAVYPRRRAAYGSICVTSRGNCSIGQPVQLPAGCVCHIPGFGKKRGAVQ